MISLFLIDDELHNIKNLLVSNNSESDIAVLGSTGSGTETTEQLKLLIADIVLLNIIAPEIAGVEYCKQLKEELPKIKVIVITDETDSEILLKIWLQRVDAILPKNIGHTELVKVIRLVMKGHRIINENIPCFFENDQPKTDRIPHLTTSEIEILRLFGSGLIRKEVAHKLNRSLYTIQFHCENIFEKFNDHKMKSILEKVRKAKIIK